MKKLFLLIFSLFSLVFSLEMQAKWAHPKDAGVSIDQYTKKIKINKDGTYKEWVHIKLTVLNQAGRDELTSYSLPYNGSSEEMHIIKAETHVGGKTYVVSKDHIEDKSIASSSSGFDDMRNLMISFPKTAIEAKIDLIYVHTVKEPILPKFFSTVLFFGVGGLWQESTVEVDSELPVYIELNDPVNAIKTSVKNFDKPHKKFKICLSKKDFVTAPIQEPKDTALDWKKLTWFALSTEQDWKAYARSMAEKYEKVKRQKLPAPLEMILEAAKKIADPYEQINFITSTVAANFQYMGDWRSVKNQFFPRNLEVITKTHTGDCKDFSALTASLLSRLGYKAEFALVLRGLGERAVPTKHVTSQSFNHVFLKVTTPKGKVLWIDPTNFVTMSRYIFPDIADKPVLILSSQNPHYEKSPALKAKENVIEIYEEVDFKTSPPTFKAFLSLKGVSSFVLTGLSLYQSAETLEDTLINLFLSERLEENEKIKIKIPDLSSRIVTDLKFELIFQKKNFLLNSNLGTAITIKPNFPGVLLAKTSKQVKDIFLGTPQTKIKHTRLLNTRLKNPTIFDVIVDTPWLTVKRETVRKNGHTDIIDTYTSKVSFIPVKDLTSKTYLEMQNTLWNNFMNAVFVLEKESNL